MLEGTEAHQSKKRHLGVTGGSKGGSLSPKKRGGKHLLTAKKALTEKKNKKGIFINIKLQHEQNSVKPTEYNLVQFIYF